MRPPVPGTEVAGHRIEGVAGRGGMGVVLRATQLDLGRTVALKVLAPGRAEDPEARERFVREVRAASAIEHPNVIPIYSAGEEDGVAYLTMRFVDGEDLGARIRRLGRLEPADAAAIAAQVASALDAAHRAGLVHRDVKPANILLGADDHAYLTDFGLARTAISEDGLTAAGSWVGTLDFIAPEQIRGDAVDGRADVYALGCVLFHALTGRVPFPREGEEARLWAHLHAAPPRPTDVVRALPRAFDALVSRAMAKRPEDRPATAGALGTAALAAAGLPGDATTSSGLRTRFAWRRRPRAFGPRTRAGAAAVLGLALLAVAAAALMGGGRDGAPSRASVAARLDAAGGGAAASRTTSPAARTRSVRVGDRPVAVTAAGGSVWVASTGLPELARVDPRTLKAHVGPVVGLGASDMAQRDGVLWIAVAKEHGVARVDARTGRRAGRTIGLTGEPRSIAATRDAIWVSELRSEPPDDLVRIDPRDGRVARLAIPEGINDVHAAFGSIWVLGRTTPNLIRVDPDRMRVVRRRKVGPLALRLDAGAGALWITNFADDTVARVTPATGEVITIGVDSKPYGIAARGDAVWVACYGAQSLVRIDPRTSRRTGPSIPVGINPIGVSAGPDTVWATSAGDDGLTRITVR